MDPLLALAPPTSPPLDDADEAACRLLLLSSLAGEAAFSRRLPGDLAVAGGLLVLLLLLLLRNLLSWSRVALLEAGLGEVPDAAHAGAEVV